MANFEAKDLTASVRINLTRKITSGGHSDVYKAELALCGDGSSTCVAVKQPRYARAHLTEKIITDVKNEIDLWSKLDHPNVLPLLGTYRLKEAGANEAESLPGAVSPWCDDGTLIEYLKAARDGRTKLTNGPMKDGSFALLLLEVELLSQATSGLEYLHAQNIIHGDMKGCNILVQDGVARLCDFGYSVLVGKRLNITSSRLGTSRWFAPESLESSAHRTREADIWALGCVVLEVCTLEVPFHDLTDRAVHTALYDGQLPYTYPPNMDMKLWRIAEECWFRDPSKRPTSRVISTHLKDVLSPLRTLANTFESSTRLPLSEFAGASLLSAVARISQEAGSDSLRRVRDVVDALVYLEDRYHPTVVRSAARAIKMRDPALAKQLMTNLSSPELRSPLRGDTAMSSVAFLSDGRRLVCSSYYTSLRICDIKTGETVIGPLKGHSNVCGVAIHGSHIASCSDDGTFRIVDADSGELVLGPISAHDGKWVNWIAYSRDGTYIATAGRDHHAALWDANTGAQVREMVGHTAPVTCVAFSEDGTRLVSGSQDGTVRIWDVSSGECIGKPSTGHKARVAAVCFGRDGRRIFSSSADRTIRIWDADGTIRNLVEETRAPVTEHRRKDDQVLPIALSPDGKRLVSGSPTGKIAMWDAETGAAVPTPFKGHDEQVLALAFSPDGRKIASASEDKTIALWDATDEWKRYDIDDVDVEVNNVLCTVSRW